MTRLRAHFRQLWDPADILDSMWNVLASPYTALFLLLGLGVLVGLIAIVPQQPAATLADPVASAAWLSSARGRFGGATDWLLYSGLLNVAHSLWLRGLLGLLALNLVLGVIDLSRPRQPSAVTAQQSQTLMTEPAEAVQGAEFSEKLKAALRAMGYRVREKGQGSRLYAHRFVLCLVMVYVGMLMAIAGLAVSERVAWWEEGVSLRPGQVRPIGHATGLAVRAEVVPMGTAQTAGSARSEYTKLTFLRQDREVGNGILRGKGPAFHAGLAFYQGESEQALLVQAQDEGGRDLMLSTPETGAAQFAQVPLRFLKEESPRYIVMLTPGSPPAGRYFQQGANERYVLVPARNLTLRLHYSAPGAASPEVTPTFQVEAFRSAERTPFLVQEFSSTAAIEISGDRYVFTPARYVVIKFGQDYGVLLLLAGGAVLLAGLVLTIWHPLQRLWTSMHSTERGGTLMIMTDATSVRRGHPWFEGLVQYLATALLLHFPDSE